MKSYLKGIGLFNEKNEKRIIELNDGINIIVGDSKTGKSALVEIIDYCLCSSRCTVPKGKITSFTKLYSIVICINDITYIIARQKWQDGGKMYFEKVSEKFDIKYLEKSYFEDKMLYNPKKVQYKIEQVLGLQVSNLNIDENEEEQKASLRNMVSYLFQHQNLIASKFALFYRFSDYNKRKQAIDQFPVFAGFIGQEYYSDVLKLKKLKSDLKKAKKLEESNEKIKEKVKNNLLPLLKDYYSLLNIEFNDKISLNQIKKILNNLPEFNDEELYEDTAIVKRYQELKHELERLRDLKREKSLEIVHLSDINSNGNDFNNILKELQTKTIFSKSNTEKYICPLCGGECKDIENDDKDIKEATEWLCKEIKMTKNYTNTFSEDVRKLEIQKDIIDSNIKNIFNQIKNIENNFIKSKKLLSKRDKINYAKARIELYSDMMNDNVFQLPDKDIEELKSEIECLERKIDGFDVKNKMKKAEVFLSKNMNKLAKGLDFEQEYNPINLNFDLQDTFNLYQYQNYQKISLDEMGSGANWVSSHIALFLSILRLFAQQKEKSPMPLIMFFDQPSQVYFPNGVIEKNMNEESDILAVNNMYETIFNEIESIKNDTEILPQLIIVDHVDEDILLKDVKVKFIKYRNYDWRNNEGLI